MSHLYFFLQNVSEFEELKQLLFPGTEVTFTVVLQDVLDGDVSVQHYGAGSNLNS